MDSSPVPPPEPPAGYMKPIGRVHSPNSSPSPDARSIRPTTAGLLQFPAPAHLLEEQHSLLHTRPLVGQPKRELFKDELRVRQNQMNRASSERRAQGVSIDEQLRRRSLRANDNDARLQSLPDKLVSSGAMGQQKDKRPFAYSPDVNDPNNRGKLDLSQIKSPIMRRRLLANMESKSQEDLEEIQGDGNEAESHREEEQKYKPVVLAAARTCKPVIAPKPQHLMPKRQPSLDRQQVKPQVVCFSEAPKFYYTNCGSDNTIKREKSNLRGQATRTHESLDEEIARSLDSLTLLANSLDKQHRAEPATNTNGKNASLGYGMNQNNNDYHQQGYTYMSTFQPNLARSGGPQSARPNFYSTLPSGRVDSGLAEAYEPKSMHTGTASMGAGYLPADILGQDYSRGMPTTATTPMTMTTSAAGDRQVGARFGSPANSFDQIGYWSGGGAGRGSDQQVGKSTSLARDFPTQWQPGRGVQQQQQQQQQQLRFEAAPAPAHRSPYWRQRQAQQLRQMTGQLENEIGRLEMIESSRF